MTDFRETRVQEALPYGFEDTSFQAAGGIPGVKKLVSYFFRSLDKLPEAQALRSLYPEDTTRSQEKLGRYLCGWLGGPQKYQEKFGKIKIVEAHKPFDITPDLAETWTNLMQEAIDAQRYSPKFSHYFKEQIALTVKRIVRG